MVIIMPKKKLHHFSPQYTITPTIAQDLIATESIKEKAVYAQVTLEVLTNLRKSARLNSIHYSTAIEGNRFSIAQVKEVLEHKGHFPGRERDEKEIKGYYAALSYVEQLAKKKITITENIIQTIHAYVMSNGSKKIIPTSYHNEQNVIYDGKTRQIVYMPPEAKDVPALMKQLVEWINASNDIPTPIVASIAHYQFATIHPYMDGNGRTARLLTMLILYLGGYDIQGLYSLEEYYARDLNSYYDAISIGPSHNYYMGREEADITTWISYFMHGMRTSFEKILMHLEQHQTSTTKDISRILRKLDQQQRKVLELFQKYEIVTAKQIGQLFGFAPRTSSQICKKWIENGFLIIVNPSKKSRSYRLADEYSVLLD